MKACQTEFYLALKHRDPHACQAVMTPFLQKCHTDVQYGSALMHFWDSCIRYLRIYYKNPEKCKRQLSNLGEKYKMTGHSHSAIEIDAFNSASMLLLEFVIKKHGPKWHTRLQTAWVWGLQIINQCLIDGATKSRRHHHGHSSS